MATRQDGTLWAWGAGTSGQNGTFGYGGDGTYNSDCHTAGGGAGYYGGGAGTDPSGFEKAWLFISGSRDGSDGEQVLFGGNVIVSGSLTGSGIASRLGEDLTVASDGNISFVINFILGNLWIPWVP